jgi:uncharacterized membrane protein
MLGDRQGDIDYNLAATFLFFIFGAIILVPLSLFVPVTSILFLIPCYISSLLYTIYAYAFVASLATGETSLVTPIYSLNGLILVIFSFFFLSEPLTLTKVIGVLLMITGASFLKDIWNPLYSLQYIITDIPTRMMFLAIVSQSLGRIIDKYYLPNIHPVIYATVLYFFISFNLLAMLFIRGNIKIVKEVLFEKPKLSISSGITNGFSYLFLLYAMRQLDLSLAEPLSNLSVILTLLFSAIIFRENILEKIPGTIIILAGGWLLYLNF